MYMRKKHIVLVQCLSRKRGQVPLPSDSLQITCSGVCPARFRKNPGALQSGFPAHLQSEHTAGEPPARLDAAPRGQQPRG